MPSIGVVLDPRVYNPVTRRSEQRFHSLLLAVDARVVDRGLPALIVYLPGMSTTPISAATTKKRRRCLRPRLGQVRFRPRGCFARGGSGAEQGFRCLVRRLGCRVGVLGISPGEDGQQSELADADDAILIDDNEYMNPPKAPDDDDDDDNSA